MARLTGTLDLDGSTIKLDQGGNATTLTSNSPAGDITHTLPATATLIVGAEHGGDATKAVLFTSDGATTAKTLTLDTNHSDDRTLTLPDATDTLVGKATTDTLTNKTLGDTNTINAQDDAFSIDDASDATKQILFNAAGTTSTATTITGSQTGNVTLTLPDATDTLVGKATTDTLTNKTLTSPTFSTIENSGTLTLPAGADTLVGRATTDTLTNKTLTAPIVSAGSTLTLDDQASIVFEDDTGDQAVTLSAATGTTSHSLTWPTAQGAANTALCNDGAGAMTWANALTTSLNENALRIGDSANTAASTDTAAQGDILADDVTGLTIKSAVVIDSPVLTTPQINDTSADHQYVVAVSELAADRTVTLPLLGAADEFVFADHAVTLTNKTLTTPIIASISNSGTITVPTGTDTLVGKATTDTLTNKTLTAPIINAATVSGTVTLSATPVLSGAVTLSGGAISLDNAVTINESGADVDFRVEGDTITDLLFVDASTDRVGINTSSPGGLFEIKSAGTGSTNNLRMISSSNTNLTVFMGDVGADAGGLVLRTGDVDTHIIRSDAETVFNSNGAALDFRIEGDTNQNLFFVDASANNIGIGTSTPGTPLQIKASVSGATGGFTLLSDNSANDVAQIYSVTDTGIFKLLEAGAVTVAISANGDSYLAGGDVGIGESSPNARLHVGAAGQAVATRVDMDAGGTGLLMVNTDTTVDATNIMQDLDFTSDADVTGAYYMKCQDSGGIIGSIRSNGTGTDFNVTSDARLKTNIQPSTDGLNIIGQISPVAYDWVHRPGKTGKGFIAQDLHAVYPEAVSPGSVTGEEEYDEQGRMQHPWSVDHSKLVPVLVKAAQELKAENDTLRADLAALLARVEALENA